MPGQLSTSNSCMDGSCLSTLFWLPRLEGFPILFLFRANVGPCTRKLPKDLSDRLGRILPGLVTSWKTKWVLSAKTQLLVQLEICADGL
jgi:hypothetical protein